MTIGHLIAFNIALLAAIVSPGPALLVALRTTLSDGRRAGIAIGFGLGLIAAMWTLAALLGLEVVFRIFPWAWSAARICGASYLLYLAWRMWRDARRPVESGNAPARNAFFRGVLINLLNPKSVLFAAAVLIVVFPPDIDIRASLLVVANHLLIEWLFYTLLAFGMSSGFVSAGYLRARVWLDRASAVVLGALGLRLLVDR